MTDEMLVEAVARALYVADTNHPTHGREFIAKHGDIAWEQRGEVLQNYQRDLARAALALASSPGQQSTNGDGE